MNKFKSILESLKDLDIDKAAALFDAAVGPYTFYHARTPDSSAMFIFPDGRILAFRNSNEDEDYVGYDEEVHSARMDNHNDLYQYVPEYSQFTAGRHDAGTVDQDIGFPDEHPANNDYLAKVYNLVLVAAHHTNNWILIPQGVEPTPGQQAVIAQFIALGYKVEDANNE